MHLDPVNEELRPVLSLPQPSLKNSEEGRELAGEGAASSYTHSRSEPQRRKLCAVVVPSLFCLKIIFPFHFVIFIFYFG